MNFYRFVNYYEKIQYYDARFYMGGKAEIKNSASTLSERGFCL